MARLMKSYYVLLVLLPLDRKRLVAGFSFHLTRVNFNFVVVRYCVSE